MRLAAAMLAGGLLLAACGGTEEAAEPAAPTTPSTTETVDEEEVLEPAEFIFAAAGVPTTLDFWTSYQGDPTRNVMYEMMSTLVEYDATALTDAGCAQLATTDNLRPGLAESWEYNADRTQLIFKLREGVLSPLGNELTAEDVVWSYDRARTQSNVVRFLMYQNANFNQETAFEVVDRYTVAANLDAAGSLDAAVLTWGQFIVLDSTEVLKHATEADPFANEWLITNHVNFGPWQLEAFEPGVEVVLTPNENFWKAEERGNIDRLVIRQVDEAATRVQLVTTGEVDYAERLSFSDYEALQGVPSVQVANCLSHQRDTLVLNTTNEYFDDPKVRRAVSLAIDRPALVAGVYRGIATPTTNGLSEAYWTPSASSLKVETNVEAAKALLAEAGHPDGFAMEIVASPSRPGAHAEALAIQIQAMLAEVGIDVSIRNVAVATEFSDLFFAGEYDAILYLEPPAVGDPFYSLNLYNTTGGFQNTHQYSNARYDELTTLILRTPSGAERDAYMAEVSDIVVEDVPMVYLVERNLAYAFSVGVGNYVHTPHGQLQAWEMVKRS
jgi:peptide/nickel transport system substrate-binding protein